MNPNLKSLLYSFVPSKKRGFVILGIALVAFAWNAYSQNSKTTPIQSSLPSPLKAVVSTPPKVVLGEQTASGIPTGAEMVKIKKVVDGDTIDAYLASGKAVTIRLIGINTPEVVDPRKPVECFGKEASQKAKEMMLKGDTVYLKADPTQDDKDKYTRLLRYVWLADGTSVNLKMIADGYAYEYTYAIPYQYQDQFKQAQSQAEKAKLGLWSDATCKGVK